MYEDSRPVRQSLPLPLWRPRVIYILLALIGLVYLAETLLGGSTRLSTLRLLGAQVNSLVGQGQYWRLVAAMFLHIGLMHLLFNGWALYSLGQEVETFYGPWRFAAIYFLSGLFGNLATYLLGGNVLSAGASGAVFGLVGADIAFFLTNRRVFGSLSRQQLGNLAVLVVINLVFGFTAQGVNNLAHLGGLAGGLALGLALTPRYGVSWQGLEPQPQVVDRTPMLAQAAAVLLALILLAAGLQLGNQRWGPG